MGTPAGMPRRLATACAAALAGAVLVTGCSGGSEAVNTGEGQDLVTGGAPEVTEAAPTSTIPTDEGTEVPSTPTSSAPTSTSAAPTTTAPPTSGTAPATSGAPTSGAPTSAPPTSTKPTPPPTSLPANVTAPQIAYRIGCGGVVVAQGSTSDSGTVNCRYKNRTLGIVNFATPEAAKAYVARQGKDQWFVVGDKWVAGLGDKTTAQGKEIAEQIASSVGGEVRQGG